MMIKKVLDNLKIASLNKMQLAAIEAGNKQQDIVLYSPTGSGKTLGFLLPVLNKLDKNSIGVQALILVPSRELAIQIEQVFRSMSTGFKVNCCYGGHSTKVEKNNLTNPPAVLVGTPGRIAFHIRNNSFNESTVNTLVLDEFDKSLEFGFKEDMSFIINSLDGLKKRILTSATRIDEMPSFAGVNDPITIDYLNAKNDKPTGLTLKLVKSPSKDKLDTLFELLCHLGNKTALVFCNHRESVDRISELLLDKGLSHGVFHGGMDQIDRERALIKFRNGSYGILITTDLASRGLDIPEIDSVIHYQTPFTEEIFIHRNGRTARMKADGASYLILSAAEKIPVFISESIAEQTLSSNNNLPDKPEWKTVYIGLGKKDKVNKIDIVGLLLKKGGLEKEELGLIEVLDFSSYAAVSSKKTDRLISLLENEKIKNKKVKIEVSL